MQIKRHLTRYEREQIEYYLRLKMGIRGIAKRLGRNHATVSREVRRNGRPGERYGAHAATELEERRRRRRKGRKLEKDLLLHDYVVRKLRGGWAPHAVAGRIREYSPPELRGKRVSHEAIYGYIYEGEGRWEGLYRHLPYKRRSRRKQGRRKHRKILIPERISIHLRPAEVERRETVGHWESDTVIYSKQKLVLSVQIERVSKLARIHCVPTKTAEETEHAIRKTVESLPPELFKTMTFDNGSEGANHRAIRDEYGIATYFCDPYKSWQKGSVENVNGIIRRFLPRKTNLSVMTDREIHEIQETLNNTPRKSLGYRTPNEVVTQYLQGGGALLT